MPPVTVRRIQNERDFSTGDLKTFFEFPWTLYKQDPNWVPPLVSSRKHLLDKSANPSWDYLEGEYYVAYRGERPVGTIAAFVNHRHNEKWKEKIGWFGFFECYDDQEAATALLQTAYTGARERGMTTLRGPANFTLNDECALLIENFSRPAVLMPYNPPYYRRLIEESGLGFMKAMDMESWYSNPDLLAGPERDGLPEKLVRVAEKTRQKRNVTIRQATVASLKGDLQRLKEVFASAWENNWGAVAPTDREVEDLFKNLKDYFDPVLARFAEVNGEMVGFVIALPDMNQLLHKVYPHPHTPEWITLIKAAWYWKIAPRLTGRAFPNGCRVMLMGVKPEYRTVGIEAMLNLELFKGYLSQGHYWDADNGWFLEINQGVIGLAKAVRAQQYKRFRIFDAPILTDSEKG
jgi:predicted transcriptional regulator